MATPTPNETTRQAARDLESTAKAEAKATLNQVKAAATDATSQLKDAVLETKETVKREGARTIDAVRSELKHAATAQQVHFAAGLSGVGQALEDAAQNLEAQSNPTFAAATRSVAGYIDRISSQVEHTSPQEMLRSARRTAMENPALVVAGGALLGFALGRFFRASQRKTSPDALVQRHMLPPNQPPASVRRAGRALVPRGFEPSLAPMVDRPDPLMDALAPSGPAGEI